jgi:hypothetical protein
MKILIIFLLTIFLKAEFLVGVGGYDCCKIKKSYKNYDRNCTINCNITDYTKKELPNVNGISIWITKDFDFKSWFKPENINQNIIKNGYTPIFIVYWYRDDISKKFVEKNKKEYFEFIKKFNIYLTKIEGKKYIILNPEYNQNGVESWEGFNEYWIKSYNILKTKNRKIGIGIGDFGVYDKTFDIHNWNTFDKSINKAVKKFDFVSFQEMRATNKNSEYDIKNTPYRSLEFAKFLYEKYKKPTFLAYLAISSYESKSQEFVYKRYFQLMDIFKKEASLIGFNIFHLWDSPQQVGYFQTHEKYFGILDKDGNKKPSFKWFRKIKEEK